MAMKRILCPVDFSAGSRVAFDRALALARATGAALTVLHVHALASPAAAAPFGPEGPGPFGLAQMDRHEAIAQLQQFVATGTAPDVAVDRQVSEGSAVHREILTQADRLSADLIVMGTHGRSGFDRLLLGSVTDKVLRSAAVPVLTVPDAPAPAGAPAAPFARIVCAVDFSESSGAVLDRAVSLARLGEGRVTLVHVVELLPIAYEPMVTPPFDAAQYRAAVEKVALAQLHAMVPVGMRDMCPAHVVSAPRAYEGILNTARDRQADLIVIGVHGRNLLDRLLFGSTTERVIRRATCPVLSVRIPA